MTDSSRRISASFRDPSGFVFRRSGQLYRQVNTSYRDDYDLLVSSGLYNRLTAAGWLVKHEEVQVEPLIPESCYRVIQPEDIGFISYPYEWSFSQLKDAALLTLAIQKEALKTGMILKDASAYNIQFYNGSPILIDTLSFTRYQEGSPWVAYRQFCQHFLASLALMAKNHIGLQKLLQADVDGIPLELASRLLPWPTRLDAGLQMHIHLHAFAQASSARSNSTLLSARAGLSRNALTGLLESLEKTIRSLTWRPDKTRWVEYYRFTNYSGSALDEKAHLVRDFLHELNPHLVFDLGANTGEFSRLSSDLTDCRFISVDNDPGAVEVNYLECKKQGVRNVLPLVVDLANPSPAVGWGNEERQSFLSRGPADVVMALALIHHLAISNNVPLEEIAWFFASLGRHLIIEFVPKEDSQVVKLLSARDDIFHDYHKDGFLLAFKKYFSLQYEIPITGTQRALYLLKRIE